ncbi:hypothetical protein, partial [Collinsella sp. LCP21S3_C7]|uniref:hypothetical protein n=1 Tax=Collinsella sp. LCP21S3_C7 TaxID=3438772 RepID=UPI003F93CEA7
ACGQGRGGIGYQPYSRFWDAGPTRFGSGTTPTFSTLPQSAMRTIKFGAVPSLSKGHKHRLHKAEFHYLFAKQTTLKN